MNIGLSVTALGLLVVVGAVTAYLGLLFVIHGFTYRTVIFHAAVATGMVLALLGWLAGGNGALALAAQLIGIVWFLVAWRELRLVGSTGLRVRAGDAIPPFVASTTDGRRITEQDLVASAPVLLVLYRGWWCPTSKVQLNEVIGTHDELRAAGVTVFAGSVDAPAEAEPLQRHVGDRITILCDIPLSLLDAIGVRDTRGAPWYDRLLFGAQQRDISMPAAVVIDASGRIAFAQRSIRVDDRPRPSEVLASLPQDR